MFPYRGREASFAYIALMIASPFGPVRRSNDSLISGCGTSMPHLALPLPEKVTSQPSQLSSPSGPFKRWAQYCDQSPCLSVCAKRPLLR